MPQPACRSSSESGMIPFAAALWQVHDSILYQVETVNLVLYTHIEWCSDRSFFLISMNGNIVVVTFVCKFMDQCRISVECEDDRFIFCKDCIIFCITLIRVDVCDLIPS